MTGFELALEDRDAATFPDAADSTVLGQHKRSKYPKATNLLIGCTSGRFSDGMPAIIQPHYRQITGKYTATGRPAKNIVR
jgi:hypothetical protein